jgi:phosphate transport system protein
MSKMLDQELDRLRQRVLPMAQSVGESLSDALAALTDGDERAAREVGERDEAVNQERFALEAEAIALLARQQPMAGDLRFLIGLLQIVTELERMGDYTKDIAGIAARQAAEGPVEIAGLRAMREVSQRMLDETLQAFIQNDPARATSIARLDDEVDKLCRDRHRWLLEQAHENPRALEQSLHLLQVVHDIERFADRITNICECIVYIATGEHVEFEDPCGI